MTAFAVVTGGGTSGHVLPALAVAEGLVAAGHDPASIHYIGARRGIETRLLPPTPYPHTFLDVIGLQRRLERSNLAFPFKLLRAAVQAARLLGRLRPRVIVSVGGYASLPAVLAGWVRRIPIVVVSYDRRPGQSSRLTARIAAAAAVAYPDSPLPRARCTGAPLRRSVLAVDRVGDRAAARAALGLPEDRFVVAVLGGSLGSGVLNDAVAGLVEHVAARHDLAVRHVVGERFLDRASPARTGEAGILYQVIGYEEHMPLVYAAADLLVTRAGASTIAELAAVGVPAIVVPWAGAAEDHQTANARSLGDHGAAVVVPEAECSAERLATEIDALAGDPARLQALAVAAWAQGEAHRSDALARLIDEVAAR
jgi:UDP-N-acetylglucosamine--N-acetylmuramyl-(pentapeptide) pyrophosphoryl-undecaprenol N-acetylglucosamine transferase